METNKYEPLQSLEVEHYVEQVNMTEAKRSSKKRRPKADSGKEEPKVELDRESLPIAPQEERQENMRGHERSRRAPQGPQSPMDTYLYQLYFDEQKGVYVASIAEIPELRVEGESQEEVVTTLQRDLEDYAIDREHEGKVLPPPLSRKKYPNKLSVTISPDLYRRLEVRSIQERVELERLAAEILAEGVQKRGAERTERGSGRSQGQSQMADRGGGRENRHSGNNRRGGRQHGNHGQQRKRGFDYHGTMESRENFMDYVRKLEKGQRK